MAQFREGNDMNAVKRMLICLAGAVLAAGLALPVSAKVEAAGELKAMQDNLREIAKQVNPSVVLIVVEKKTSEKTSGGKYGFNFDFPNDLRKFFKGDNGGDDEDTPKKRQKMPQYKSSGMGSGFVVTADGYVITNYHVIEDANSVKVTMFDETTYDAEVKGYDKRHDVAVVKIKSDKKFRAAELGDSDQTLVGDIVIAIGNPFGYSNTVTMGIVSAKGRLFDNPELNGAIKRIPNIIQTDAAINPGNSGGPLLNISGEVIGVNMAIAGDFSTGNVGNMGLGFAIPIKDIKKILESLIKGKKSVAETPWVGIRLQDIDTKLAKKLGIQSGVLIPEVDEKGPGKAAGLLSGDVVVKLDGKEISNGKQLAGAVASKEVGDPVVMTVNRGGKEKDIKIVLAPWGEKSAGENGVVKKEEGTKKSSSIGVTVKTLTDKTAKLYGLKSGDGVVVTGVEDGSIADNAEIAEGDIIKEVDRKGVKSAAEFDKAIEDADLKAGILMLVEREETSRYVVLVKE